MCGDISYLCDFSIKPQTDYVKKKLRNVMEWHSQVRQHTRCKYVITTILQNYKSTAQYPPGVRQNKRAKTATQSLTFENIGQQSSEVRKFPEK